MPENSPQASTFLYRLDQHERELGEVDHWRRDVDKLLERLSGEMLVISKNQDLFAETVARLRNTLLGFAFTIAGSAVIFAFSILVATGKI